MASDLVTIRITSVSSDPDIKVGGILTIERADGRSVWRERMICVSKRKSKYVMSPVDEFGKLK